MKYCQKCKVFVAGEREFCPLCQQKMTVEEGLSVQEVFPEVPLLYKKHSLFFRILIFASIFAAVLSVFLNLVISTEIWWSVFVVAGLVCTWISVAVAINKRRNIPKNVVYQVVVLSLLCIWWDYFTGWRGWSINFVLPILCLAAMFTLAIISRVLSIQLEDYLIHLIVSMIFGIIPLIFLLNGAVTITLPSLICVAGSLLSIIGLVVFAGDRMYTELKRRLHL